MARRRIISSVDTSDRLANVVLGSLLIGLVALFGLVAVLTSDDEADPQQASGTEVPNDAAGLATIEPSPTAADEPEDDPGDGVAAAPTTVPEEPPASVTPLRPREDRTVAATPGTGDDGITGGATPDAGEPAAPGDGVDGEGPADGALPPEEEEDLPADAAPPPDDGARTEAPPSGDGPGQVDEPVVPPSGIDDADRVPALVISDEPIDVHTVLADLDGDDVPERVRAAIVRNAVRVVVERYAVGGEWRDVDTAAGAVADDLVGLWVQDLNGDGRADIHTRQWVGTNGESVSLWSFSDSALQSMTASGGCWDGSHTFGVVGALVHPGEVKAICEEDPLPPSLWSTAVYRWQNGRWTFQELVGVYRPR